MKTLIILTLGAFLSSCVDSPSMTEITPEGTRLEYKMGRTVMGKQKQLVVEITGPNGRKMKMMVGEIDTTEVAKQAIRTGGAAATAIGLANATADEAMNASDNETAVTLGAQGVQKNKDTLEAAGKATSEAIPLVEGGPTVLPIKPPGS